MVMMPIMTVIFVRENVGDEDGVIRIMGGLVLVIVQVIAISRLVQLARAVMFLRPTLESN